ncbi:MAG: hypothetical protein GY793_02855 [Proteobacteria bacterium]|nr:hypothetical protein [Pseudomonadota bacterium]
MKEYNFFLDLICGLERWMPDIRHMPSLTMTYYNKKEVRDQLHKMIDKFVDECDEMFNKKGV